jgi:hypothetical protein
MAVTTAERTDLRQWLDSQGIAVEIIDRRAPKAEWWRASDGKYLGTLPADPYHMQVYRRKGFVMADPGFRKEPEPIADFKGFWEQQQAAAAEPEVPSAPDLSKYTHSCGYVPRADSKNLVASLMMHKRRCKESTDGD